MEESRKTSLVVDDEKTNLVRARMLLQEEFNPILVNSGEQCLKYLQNHKPDLILLDIMMPDMDGWQVMKQLKKDPDCSAIPVIFLTADSNPNKEKDCFEAGAVDFTLKPIQPASVLPRIRRAIELEGYRKDLQRIVDQQNQKILDMKYQFVVSIANLVDNCNNMMGEHVKRTAQKVKMLALQLQKQGYEQETLTDKYIEHL